MLHGRDLVDLEQLRQSHFGYRLAALAGKHERAAAVAERPRRFLILLASLRLRPRRRTGRAGPRTPEVDGRTPCLDCLDRHPRGWACARPCYPPLGAPVQKNPCRKAVEPSGN